MLRPVFTTKTHVATNSAETFSGSDTVEEFVYLDFGTSDEELYSIVDPDTGQVIAGADRFFGHFPANATAIFVDVFDDITVDYSFSPSPVHIDLNRETQHGGFAEGDRLTDVFSVIGSSSNDTIRGSDLIPFELYAAQAVFNDPGSNSLFGGGGNDIIEGRSGADLINGGPGNDTASYESSPSGVVVTVNNPATSAFTATGGDAEGDHLFSIENVIGSRFDDRLTGSSNDNILTPGLGNDIVDGQGGRDTVDYSADRLFDDTPSFRESADRVVVHLGLNGVIGTATEFTAGPSTLDALVGIENVIGTRGDDIIVGNEAANTLEGRGGDDTLDGGLGNDVIIGGNAQFVIGTGLLSSIDTVSYASHDAIAGLVGPDVISLGQNGADGSYTRLGIVSTPTLHVAVVESDVLVGIENVTGSNGAETITGNEQDNTLAGRGGADTLDGRGGDDHLYGGSGKDVLIGGTGDDLLAGGDDDDMLTAGTGDDVIYGDGGIDTAIYGDFDVAAGQSFVFDLRPEIGTATLVTKDGMVIEFDTLTEVENIVGSGAADIFRGNSSSRGLAVNNEFWGRGGDDTFEGDLGHDTYHGDSGIDVVDYRHSAAVSIDLRSGGSGGLADGDRFFGIENAVGSAFNDVITGNDLNNRLSGGQGDDTIDGGIGDDVIVGGGEIDIEHLTGGQGRDTFVYSARSDSNTTATRTGDFILDFNTQDDLISLRAIGVNAADLMITNTFSDGIHFARVLEDLNHNGLADSNELSINLIVTDSANVTLQDVLI